MIWIGQAYTDILENGKMDYESYFLYPLHRMFIDECSIL